MADAERKPLTYAQLIEMHACDLPADQKKAVFTIMEDGSLCLIIGQQSEETGAWRVMEHLTMKRDDFNVWLHQLRQWWTDEKLHPLVPNDQRRPRQ